jgi:hypothetical protein
MAGHERHGAQLFRRHFNLLVAGEIIVGEIAVARKAIEPVQRQMLFEFRHAEEPFDLALTHVGNVFKAHVIGDQGFHLFDDRVGIAQAIEHRVGDFDTLFDMAVEADTVGDAESGRLADVV